MEIRCPACGRVNTSENRCARCEADLTSLRRIHEHSACLLIEARVLMKQCDYSGARQAVERSWRLKHSPAAARLAFMACLGQRAFKDAAGWYDRILRF